MEKLWDKQYKLNKKIEQFTVGNDYLLDQKLVKFDIIASIAHAKMLHKIGILNKEETKKIVDELNVILDLDKKGEFIIQKEDEDCHTAIEKHLTKKLGTLGKKIHTARSRNDQVITALRLYYKAELNDCKKQINDFIKTIEEFVKEYGKIELPGYTHTRKAMPSSIALWGNAIIDSMKDNIKILNPMYDLIDQSPLGSGAGYDIPLEIDKQYTSDELGFKKVQINPIYVGNSRGKFESTILHAMTQIMFDMNKIASDIIFFTIPELGFFELPDEICTGSSIMPQKKNPDVLEVVRAKYHVVTSYEFQVKNIISNLISGYNRDFQHTKEPTIKGIQITKDTVDIMKVIFSCLKVNKDNCKKALTPELFATKEVYDLVKKGIPFREAYQKISKKY
jgi:argininosuccinate lyase